MSDSLTTLIGKVQALLGDDGTIFTTALCTAAVRQALTEYNQAAPQFLAVTIVGVNNQYEYELSDEDSLATSILDVLQRGENNNEFDISLTYDAYVEDERLFFRLRAPVTTSNTLIVRYTRDHIINGLDSQVQSTINAREDQVIVDGACYQAIMTRATARIESINLSKEQSDNYREIAGNFQRAFNTGLTIIRNSRKSAVGEPDSRAWNDQYHHWGQ